jgi:hypothetical protein
MNFIIAMQFLLFCIFHCHNPNVHTTNAFLKTTVCNNVFVVDFIVHYLLNVSAPIGGHLQVICTQSSYLTQCSCYSWYYLNLKS